MHVEEECDVETPCNFVGVASEQDVEDCDTEKGEDYQPEEYEEGPVDMQIHMSQKIAVYELVHTAIFVKYVLS